jgi:polyisoprenoid-binding protein YceI
MSAHLHCLSALLIIAATPVVAADAHWQSSIESSELSFSAWYEGEEIPGRFSRFSVTLTTDAATGEPVALSVEIDVASADMNDDEINRELAEPEWFDSAAFPAARFAAANIQPSGAGYMAAGRLRIKDIERLLEVPFDWRTDGDLATLTGSVELSRLAWQVGVGEWSSDASLAERVRVKFDLQLLAVP